MRLTTKKLLSILLAFTLLLSLSTAAFGEEKVKETDSDAKIKLEVHHAIITKEGDKALIRETLKFVNEGDSAYIGQEGEKGAKEVLKLSLPKSYTDLKIMGVPENKVIIREGELVTTTPVQPGTLQLTVNYVVPASQYGEHIIDKKINYLTEVFYILSPEGDFDVKGEGIVSGGVQEIDGAKYQVFYNELSRPGEGFEVTAKSAGSKSNLVSAGYQSDISFHSASHISRWMSSPLNGTDPHIWTAFLILLILAMAFAATMLIREKRKHKETEEADEKLNTLYDRLVIKEKRLLDKIRAVDKKLETGEVTAEGHKGLREQYKKMLIDVKLKLRELEELDDLNL